MFLSAEEEIVTTKSKEAAAEVKADLDYVTLIVGDANEAIKVHKEVLCESSTVFNAACKPEWMNADTPVIE